MIAHNVLCYLEKHRVPFMRLPHARAVPAQRIAQQLHVTGRRLAKTVVVEVDGERWLLALPATERVDERRLAEVMHARRVRLLDEDELAPLFPGCEVGAEPPFGRLYGLPMLCDGTLAANEEILVRAGSHDEVLRLCWKDFEALERPVLVQFGVPFTEGPGVRREVEPSIPPAMR